MEVKMPLEQQFLMVADLIGRGAGMGSFQLPR